MAIMTGGLRRDKSGYGGKAALYPALIAFALLLTGCSYLPRDAHGWTDEIRRSGVLTVGTGPEEGKDASAGVTTLTQHEQKLVEDLARRLNARLEWKRGNIHTLLQALEEREIPLVAAHLPSDTPFAQKVGLSRPYVKKGPEGKDYCLAVAPGENRLLLRVDEVIIDQEKGGTPP